MNIISTLPVYRHLNRERSLKKTVFKNRMAIKAPYLCEPTVCILVAQQSLVCLCTITYTPNLSIYILDSFVAKV